MMDEYQHSLENMNNAAVEYIRGISVVKAFKQTVYSFHRLHETIKEYTSVVIPYTLSWENMMSAFMTIINHIYLLLLPVGILIGMNTGDFKDFASRFIFIWYSYRPLRAFFPKSCMSTPMPCGLPTV